MFGSEENNMSCCSFDTVANENEKKINEEVRFGKHLVMKLNKAKQVLSSNMIFTLRPMK